MSDGADPWGRIHDSRDELERIAERDDRLGALAAISLDLADGDLPSDDDLQRMGVTADVEDGQ